jgi:hypothetical protein
MIAMTNANMKNLPPTPVSAKLESYKKHNDARDAAIKAIGPEAREGYEFEVWECDGYWLWKKTAEEDIPAPSGFQIKINGGKRAFPTLADRQRHKDLTKPADTHAPESRDAIDFSEKLASVLRTLDDESVQLIVDELMDVPSNKVLREQIRHLTELLRK